MPYQGPVTDDHFHLNRNGRFLDAARDFHRAGGTDLILVHCPDFRSPPVDLSGHRAAYADTVAMAAEVRKEVNLDVRVVLGPHPAAFAHQFEAWSIEGEAGRARAVEAYESSIDAAVEFIDEGLAHAVGEVGRPHWKVSDDVWALSNQLLASTMARAAKQGFALQLHVEGESDATYPELAEMADRAGLPRDRLVRHYAPADVRDQATHGIVPSVLCGQGALPVLLETMEAASGGFLLETDHMDDPKRPGAVLGPKTVPKRTKQLVEAGVDDEVLYRTHVDLPERLYGPRSCG
jgi:TatD-related deoxyribonuclease